MFQRHQILALLINLFFVDVHFRIAGSRSTIQ